MLSAISKERGQEHFAIYDFSVNVSKFKQWLQGLRDSNSDGKICLFLDNLSAHRSKKSLAEMERLDFKWIFNIAYSPEYNPIELTFSKVKSSFRKLRAKKLAGLIQDSHRSMVEQAVKSVRK